MDDDSRSQRTALHESTEGGHVDITELLLKQSEVDPTVRDARDKTPYDIAYSKRNEEVCQVMPYTCIHYDSLSLSLSLFSVSFSLSLSSPLLSSSSSSSSS